MKEISYSWGQDPYRIQSNFDADSAQSITKTLLDEEAPR